MLPAPRCRALRRARRRSRDPRCDTRALRRRTADDQVGSQRDRGSDAQRDNDGALRPERRSTRSTCERRMRPTPVSESHRRRRLPVAPSARGPSEHRTGDEPAGRGHRPQPRFQWRVAQHELQVLGDEEEDPECDREAEAAGGEGRAEGAAPEQPQVDERSARDCCRRTNTKPTTRPTRIERIGVDPKPCSAMSFSP